MSKAAIMPRDHLFSSQVLPFLLLGVCTTAREEFTGKPAHLVYGENLQVPGDLTLYKKDGFGETELLHLLLEVIAKLQAPPPSRHAHIVTNNPRDLRVCIHVLVGYHSKISSETIRRSPSVERTHSDWTLRASPKWSP